MNDNQLNIDKVLDNIKNNCNELKMNEDRYESLRLKILNEAYLDKNVKSSNKIFKYVASLLALSISCVIFIFVLPILTKNTDSEKLFNTRSASFSTENAPRNVLTYSTDLTIEENTFPEQYFISVGNDVYYMTDNTVNKNSKGSLIGEVSNDDDARICSNINNEGFKIYSSKNNKNCILAEIDGELVTFELEKDVQ